MSAVVADAGEWQYDIKNRVVVHVKISNCHSLPVRTLNNIADRQTATIPPPPGTGQLIPEICLICMEVHEPLLPVDLGKQLRRVFEWIFRVNRTCNMLQKCDFGQRRFREHFQRRECAFPFAIELLGNASGLIVFDIPVKQNLADGMCSDHRPTS
jgi:hypothetical protein